MAGGVERGCFWSYALSLDGLSNGCRRSISSRTLVLTDYVDLSSPSNQATKPSLVNPTRESDALALQRLRTVPRSIVPAGLELARLSRSLFGLEVCHERLVELLVAVNVVAMRALKPTVSIGLKLVRDALPECETLISRSPPAWHVGWRHRVLAVGARSGLAAMGAGSCHDVG
jgi:hypothetical protein